MATVNKLSITFVTATGTSMTLAYKYVKSNVTISNVQALITAIIANKVIFSSQPVSARSAKLIQTEETPIDISE